MALSTTQKRSSQIRATIAIADTASWYCSIIIVTLILFTTFKDSYPTTPLSPGSDDLGGAADHSSLDSKGGRLLDRPCDEIYVVSEGETLHTISDKCGDPFIVERNPHIHDPDDVFPGLVIRIMPVAIDNNHNRKLLSPECWKLEGFFDLDAGASEDDISPPCIQTGWLSVVTFEFNHSTLLRAFVKHDVLQVTTTVKKVKHGRSIPYDPQKNSVPYAMLITLYRRMQNGIESMGKQELIDSADASGLSRVSVAPQKGSGKIGKPGNSAKEWYSGWSGMTTLTKKGLVDVEKNGYSTRYKLSEEGCNKAIDCLLRSGMLDARPNTSSIEKCLDLDEKGTDYLDLESDDSVEELTSVSVKLNTTKVTKPVNGVIPVDDSNFTPSGYAHEVMLTSVNLNKKRSTSDEVPLESLDLGHVRPASVVLSSATLNEKKRVMANVPVECLQRDYHLEKASHSKFQACRSVFRMPPLGYSEKLEDAYEVILILDNREHFVSPPSVAGYTVREPLMRLLSALSHW